MPGLRTASNDQASAAELGELARVVTHEVFGHRVSKQRGDEILRDLAIVAAQDFAGGGDQRGFGSLFIGAGKIGGCHGIVPRHARPADKGRSLIPTFLSAKCLSARCLSAKRPAF